jgi:hypothetical protein
MRKLQKQGLFSKGQNMGGTTNLKTFLIMSLFLVGVVLGVAGGDVIYIDADASVGGNGQSWGTAYKYLQDALNKPPSSGDQIWVAEGTYKPDQDEGGNVTLGQRTETFGLINGVGIYGGFAGGESSLEERDWKTNVTVLSGDIGTPYVNGDNSYHVIYNPYIPYLNSSTILDGFTITGGNANGSSSNSNGGGMYTDYGSPTVSNCTFIGNSAVVDGGGMYNYFFSSPTVTNCIFNENTVITTYAWTGGGGMCNYYYSNPVVTDCNFNGNAVISLNEITGGGGMENYGSSPTVINCRFSENMSNNGGGIANVFSLPTFTSCIFIENLANIGGGGMMNLNCSPVMTECAFIGNSASFGGAMSNNGQDVDSHPTMVNCTFSGNFAQFNGGGIHNYVKASPTLTNCSFSGNEALDYGGAMDIEYGSSSTLTNCILWGNKAPMGAQVALKQNPDADPSNFAISYSAVQGGEEEVYLEGECTLEWDSNSVISDDPLFLDADGLDNEIGTDDDNLRLLFGSTCIDAGDNEADVDADTPGVQGLPLIDFDGEARFVEDPNVPNTGNGTPPIIDMGAYEGAGGTVLIVLSAESVTVVEGQTAAFDVNLGMDPQGPIEVAIAHESGDSDITVFSGALLNFKSSNYWHPQIVTLAAAEDADYLLGTAIISVTVPGVVSRSLKAIELDNEPAPSVLFVDCQASGMNDGSNWTDAFGDLQAALKIAMYAPDVEEVRVAAGTYMPDGPLGDRTATFELVNGVAIYGGFPSGGGEWAERNPNIHETILSGDLNGNDSADANNDDNSYHVVTGSGAEPNAILDGFTITAGNANGQTQDTVGGGMYNYYGSPTVINCIFSGSSAVFCGGMYNYGGSPTVTNSTFSGNSAEAWGGGMYNYQTSATLTNCTFSGNSAGGYLGRYGGGMCCESSDITLAGVTLISGNNPDNVWMGYGSVQIEGTVQVVDGNWIGIDLVITGEGNLQIDPCSVLDLDGAWIQCDLSGTGTVHVSVGSELIIEGFADVNLAHETDPNQNGQILCSGLLLVRDSVHLSNAKIEVSRASFEDDVDISNSVIKAEAGAPYGQFFIEDTVHITGNDIHADGDRYMDLDPSVFAGVIANNRIFITITEGVGKTHGGLLELRGRDSLVSSSSCDPNNEFFCEVIDVPAFDTNSWMIEELKVDMGAKVNLTNRFDFGNGGLYEVMYVKNLILEPNSLLNTAFNQLYYKNLVGDPNSVRNEPLLGFSLSNIALDNNNEFIIRVIHNNFIDPDPSPTDYSRIHVERVSGLAPDPNGMMRMCNMRDIDPVSPFYNQVINAKAKGLFAKASEDEILILFEYLFGSSGPNVELVIYLSDVPELLDHNDPCRLDHYIEVARLYPPPAGQYGSAGSDHFGVFEEIVSTGDLNFIRGVRMELELVGPDGTCILINNWDPYVSCIYCGDVTGDFGVTPRDYLTVLGESGELSSGMSGLGLPLYCLDFGFSLDGFLDTTDLLGWDWGEWLVSEGLVGHLCFDICIIPCDGNTPPLPPPVNSAFIFEAASGTPPGAGEAAGFAGSLLIAGKRFDAGQQDFLSDRLYEFDESYNLVGGLNALPIDRMNGKLVRDHNDLLYQINLEEGLVRLSDFNSVIPRGQGYSIGSEPRYAQPAAVYVGFQDQGENTWGRPFFDAAFDSQGYVYVTPVVVVPDVCDPYVAAAKLALAPGQTPPYSIVEIYDDPPLPNSNQDRDNLCEIEVDDNGNVYVVNNGYINGSDILWVYDSNGAVRKCGLQTLGIYGPTGLCCSSYDNSRLYLASSMVEPDATSASLYVLSTADLTLVQTITINNMGHITDIAEDPITGTLWLAGFTMPEYMSYLPADLSQIPQFYHPYLAAVPYGSSGPVQAEHLSDAADLALPLSIAWVGPTPDRCGGADLDGLGDVSFGDLKILASQWLQAPGTPSADIAPVLGDGIVNFLDLAVLADHWLVTCGP